MSIADRICFDLGMTNRQLLGLVSSTADRYHCFSAGGRKIVAPRPDLKLVQCWISDYINTEFDIDLPYATAYEKAQASAVMPGSMLRAVIFFCLIFAISLSPALSKWLGICFQGEPIGRQTLNFARVLLQTMSIFS